MITRGNPWTAEARRNPYPFVDTASLTDSTGLLRLSPAWITDARMWPTLAVPSRVYLSSIERTSATLVITVSSLDSVVGSVTIQNFGKRRVAIRNTAGDPVGFLSFAPGGLQQIHDVPSKLYQFPVAATEFVASALAVQVRNGLLSIGAGAGSSGGALTKDFALVGGEGIALTVRVDGGIRIDIVGDPFFTRDSCEDAAVLGRGLRPVRGLFYTDLTLNGSGVSGVVKPYAGNISTTVVSTNPDVKARGFVAPGPKMALLGRIGA